MRGLGVHFVSHFVSSALDSRRTYAVLLLRSGYASLNTEVMVKLIKSWTGWSKIEPPIFSIERLFGIGSGSPIRITDPNAI